MTIATRFTSEARGSAGGQGCCSSAGVSAPKRIDPLQATLDKLKKNESRYPAAKVKGKSLKYSEYVDLTAAASGA
jgi:hypothetical protein